MWNVVQFTNLTVFLISLGLRCTELGLINSWESRYGVAVRYLENAHGEWYVSVAFKIIVIASLISMGLPICFGWNKISLVWIVSCFLWPSSSIHGPVMNYHRYLSYSYRSVVDLCVKVYRYVFGVVCMHVSMYVCMYD